ncbi:MAG TPA: uL22 family ribosomal protein [Patescibacteria group bacterium]|nr:uL22 family ribosomal protein [Patescibacteria group bacterium]
MSTATAKVKFLKVSPKKLRPLARAIAHKKLTDAEWIIKNSHLGHAPEFWHALTNAQAMLKNKGESLAEARVAEVCVNDGPRLKRSRPSARGRSSGYKHSLSHLSLTLTTNEPIKLKLKATPKLKKETHGTKS